MKGNIVHQHNKPMSASHSRLVCRRFNISWIKIYLPFTDSHFIRNNWTKYLRPTYMLTAWLIHFKQLLPKFIRLFFKWQLSHAKIINVHLFLQTKYSVKFCSELEWQTFSRMKLKQERPLVLGTLYVRDGIGEIVQCPALKPDHIRGVAERKTIPHKNVVHQAVRCMYTKFSDLLTQQLPSLQWFGSSIYFNWKL